MKNERGFTLIELMIVIVIIGILAAIAIPNFYSMKENSVRASCIVNQRNIVQSCTLYSIETGVVNTVVNVAVLQPDYLSTPPSECPASKDASFNDYTITITNQRVITVQCDVEPVSHLWTGFK